MSKVQLQAMQPAIIITSVVSHHLITFSVIRDLTTLKIIVMEHWGVHLIRLSARAIAKSDQLISGTSPKLCQVVLLTWHWTYTLVVRELRVADVSPARYPVMLPPPINVCATGTFRFCEAGGREWPTAQTPDQVHCVF